MELYLSLTFTFSIWEITLESSWATSGTSSPSSSGSKFWAIRSKKYLHCLMNSGYNNFYLPVYFGDNLSACLMLNLNFAGQIDSPQAVVKTTKVYQQFGVSKLFGDQASFDVERTVLPVLNTLIKNLAYLFVAIFYLKNWEPLSEWKLKFFDQLIKLVNNQLKIYNFVKKVYILMQRSQNALIGSFCPLFMLVSLFRAF